MLAQAWFLLLVVDLGLRVLPFKRVQVFAAQAKQPDSAPKRNDTHKTIARLQRFVDIAARYHLYPMTCLRQALALQRLAGQRGIASELRIGVRKDGGALEAHAWVECDETPLGETERAANRFAPLVSKG